MSKKLYLLMAFVLLASMVGLVTDVGEIDDNSFDQSAWAGVKQAET